MTAHQGQQMDGAHVLNVCPDCGFFSSSWAQYPRADERLKAQKLRSRMPFLQRVCTCVASIENCMVELFPPCGSRLHALDSLRHDPLFEFVGSPAHRCVVRRLLRQALHSLVSTALDAIGAESGVSLRSVSAGSKLGNLLLLLLGVSDCFTHQFCHPLKLVSPKCPMTSPAYAAAAVLLSLSAVACWPSELLDKFITGDVGQVGQAQKTVQGALKHATGCIALLFPRYLMLEDGDRKLQSGGDVTFESEADDDDAATQWSEQQYESSEDSAAAVDWSSNVYDDNAHLTPLSPPLRTRGGRGGGYFSGGRGGGAADGGHRATLGQSRRLAAAAGKPDEDDEDENDNDDDDDDDDDDVEDDDNSHLTPRSPPPRTHPPLIPRGGLRVRGGYLSGGRGGGAAADVTPAPRRPTNIQQPPAP